jgi:hypothetical protein
MAGSTCCYGVIFSLWAAGMSFFLVQDSKPSAIRFLTPKEMTEKAKGGEPACTNSLTTAPCTDYSGICVALTDAPSCNKAPACNACNDTFNYDVHCSSTQPWDYIDCIESLVPRGCGKYRVGTTVCGWNNTNSECICGGGTTGNTDCGRASVETSANCVN